MTPVNTRTRRLLAGSLLIVAIAACSGAPAASPTPAATAAPGAAGSGASFALRTAAVKPDACMDALMGGKLAKHAQSGLGISSADGSQSPVEWPFRYSARVEFGRVILLDENGRIVAREGDEITVGGGFGNQFWHACAPVTVTKAGS
jgi:hypothetical protein